MTTIFDHFARGMQVGSALRDRARERQQQERYGSAFDNGGWGAVAKEAGSMGELATAQDAQTQQQAQQDSILARTRENYAVLGRVYESLSGLDPQTRAQRFQELRPRIAELFGGDTSALDQVDPASEESWAAAGQQLKVMGSMVNAWQTDDDIWRDIPRDQLPQGAVAGRFNPTTRETDIEWQPTQARSGGDGVRYRPATADDMAPYGIQDSSGWMINTQTGEPSPLGGATGMRQRFQMGQQQRARLQALYQQATSSDVVLRDIARARRLAPTGAGWNSLTAMIPGTDSNNLAALIDTIGANIGFDRLQQMRDASPTGGALGAVTERELVLLQAVLASLEQSQSVEQFQENLNNLERTYNASMERIRQAYYQDFGEEPPPFSTGVAPQAPGETMGGIVGGIGLGAAEGAGQTQQFTPGEVYEDAAGNAARFNADGTWTPVN